MTTAHVPASTDPTSCPGTPEAPDALPGHFCAYDKVAIGNVTLRIAFDPASATGGKAGRYGADLFLQNGSAGSEMRSHGSRAVTAP